MATQEKRIIKCLVQKSDGSFALVFTEFTGPYPVTAGQPEPLYNWSETAAKIQQRSEVAVGTLLDWEVLEVYEK